MVISVLDSNQPYTHLVGYAMLEDSWIHEGNTTLLLGDGSFRKVLDYRKEERYILRFKECMPHVSGWSRIDRAYVLLDGNVSVGDVLYPFYNESIIDENTMNNA